MRSGAYRSLDEGYGSMSEQFESNDALLLDYHLGQLDGRQREALERALARSDELAAKSRTLGELLAHLDRDEVPAPPVDLADRVLADVGRRTAAIPFETADTEPVLQDGQRTRVGGSWFGWRDVLAVAACVALFFMVAVPGFFKARNISARNLCLDNLRQISSGMTGYAAANAGFLPYAGYVPGGSWLPGEEDENRRASNTRHVFKLVSQGHVRKIRVFVCPADKQGRPMTADAAQQGQDFTDRRNNSYSFIFMNVPQGLRLEDMQQGPQRRMVLVADRNPHFPTDGMRQPVVPPTGNSATHEKGAGQNAIYVDGSGGWFTNPRIGVDADDIYRVGNLDRYQGTEKPNFDTDTFLPP